MGTREDAITRIKPWSLAFIALLFSAAVTACSLPAFLARSEPRCSPPPQGFSEDVLIGTWRAGVPKHFDELAIRRDGTYTQRVHVEYSDASPLDYEGEPHRWHLQYSDAGIPYLHLEDFRRRNPHPSRYQHAIISG
jgi:hypothetical protein